MIVPVLKFIEGLGSAIEFLKNRTQKASIAFDGTKIRFKVNKSILNIELKEDGFYIEDKLITEFVDTLNISSPSVNKGATEYAIATYLAAVGGSLSSSVKAGNQVVNGTADIAFSSDLPSANFVPWCFTINGVGVGVNSWTKSGINVTTLGSTTVYYIAIMEI